MASEQAKQALRQLSDDSFALANRVSSKFCLHWPFSKCAEIKSYACLHILQVLNDSSVTAAKENIKNVWAELVQILRQFKESAVQLSSPSILAEQLQIMFRDESEIKFIKLVETI